MPDLLVNKAKQVRRISMCVAFVFLSFINFGCTPVTGALIDSAKGLSFGDAKSSENRSTSPHKDQMRMTVNKSVFNITRVHVTPAFLTQERGEGVDEIWMTPSGEILRFTKYGRLVGSVGSAYADWSRVYTTSIPNWRIIRDQLKQGRGFQYIRYRDVEPKGYSGIKEKVDIVFLSSKIEKNSFLFNLSEDLFWFEERATFVDAAGRIENYKNRLEKEDPLSEDLPYSKFAVSFKNNSNGELIYSEQCISPLVCFKIDRIQIYDLNLGGF